MTLTKQAFGVFDHSLPTLYVNLSMFYIQLIIKKWFLEIRESPGNVPTTLLFLCTVEIEVSQPLRSTGKENSQMKYSVCKTVTQRKYINF